ncbi:PREDICTED: carotenoid cleavage dioxygenase 7, chloroplastic [Nelumbo nucifera]|uniref:Carotenoid cleavage dioxygenase 7, chloroplastic n=2 Tax=Nelumbo nucifera TaxID=4432 RepID=A0A822XI23_NELNU|nr:PREDICTED: carotenoid cleavage dioxygenase 7, chloroplastic [Nelumbo nucifera]DAD18455.1 TPA_asm: hypothetical protein HUJ06_019918 [Nelumbo nucifera]
MQATFCQAIPPKLPYPSKLSPVYRLPTRAKMISMPERQVSVPDADNSVAAFWDYQFLFVSQRSESVEPVVLRTVDGAIPADFPSGTYYLVGPGIFCDDHGSTVHPLDGHGYLRAFVVDGNSGEVRFSARYVKTEAQREECEGKTGSGRWRFTHRGPFSVLRGGKKILNTKVMKNVANTSVLRWGGRLLCMWEGGNPYELETETLDTVGRFDFDVTDDSNLSSKRGFSGGFWDFAACLLKPILYGVFKMPPKRLLAHYKMDFQRNRLLIMSCNAEDMLLPLSHFTFYEFDLDFKLLQKQEFNIPDHLMIHDWAFTDNYYVAVGNRIKLDVIGSLQALCGMSPMISALSVNPNKPTSPIYLLPRFPEKLFEDRDWRVPIDAPSQMWLLHVGNAFEQRDKKGNLEVQIQASACSYRWFNFQKLFGYNWQSNRLDPSYMNASEEEELLPHLVQVAINFDADGKCHECSVKPLNNWSRPSDFPAINPTRSGNRNTYIYTAAASGSRHLLPHFPFDMLAKLNLSNNSVSTWSVGSRRFIGEPIFVPKGNEEDDGYVLVVEYAVSIQRCYLVVLNPKIIGEAGALVARLEVPKHLNFPIGFHGFWSADC